MSYFNTINLSGKALKEAIQKARGQNEAILLYYLHKREAFSPSEIYHKMNEAGKRFLLTSVRRAITTLCKEGHLINTMYLTKGMYGSMENKWQINPAKYPTKTADQTSLFNQSENAA